MGLIRTLTFIVSGSKKFGKDGYLAASNTFDPSVLERRLDGTVCMVTGANQGLGLKTSEELAARGCTLYMVCRNAERGEMAVQAVRASSGNTDVHLKVCDVSSLTSIRKMVNDFDASGSPLHLLVNNAGVMIHERQLSADGYDINFATNTLGSFVLTQLLSPILHRSSPARVIFVSSGGMLTETLDVKDLQNKKMGSHYDGTRAYAKDKRRQVALIEHFARQWQGTGVGAYCMHPGWTTTEGVKKSIPGMYKMYQSKFRELQQGVDTIVWLALQDMDKLEAGAFYLDRAKQPKHLWCGGTEYEQRDVDELVRVLQDMLNNKHVA